MDRSQMENGQRWGEEAGGGGGSEGEGERRGA